MDYQEYAKEMVKYMLMNEQKGRKIQGKISEFAKGEEAVLYYLSHEKDGASARELSLYFQINTSRVAAILNSLCKKGYVERKHDDFDKRKIHVFITDEGRNYAKKQYNDVVNRVQLLLEQLGEEDTKEHLRIVKKISDIFSGMTF